MNLTLAGLPVSPSYDESLPSRWHFSITSVFKDPLTRQVDEAVRISKLPPESILNSKSEINHAPLNRISIKK